MVQRAMADWVPVEGRPYFLKKRSKKYLLPGVRGPMRHRLRVQKSKSFLVLFSKKNSFLCF
jgi:hypothetical protein